MPRKTRKGRGGAKKISFTPNTKRNTNINNFTPLLPSSMRNMSNVLFTKSYPSSEMQAENALIFAELQKKYNNPTNMHAAINQLYAHEGFTNKEKAAVQPYLQEGKIHTIMNRIMMSSLPESLKQKTLKYLRHMRQQFRIKRTYETNHPPRFVYPEWEPANNSGYQGDVNK